MERDAVARERRAFWGWAWSGAILLTLAFPPVGFWPLAWLAPACWAMLIVRPHWPVRRPYLGLYGVGLAYWLVNLQGVRLAHWALYFGWFALAAYLAVYLPLFVAVGRTLVHRWRWPLAPATAVAWTGLELFRAYFATGFTGGLLAHSQTPVPALIQSAEWGGAYLVGWLILFAAGCGASALQAFQSGSDGRRRAYGWAAVAAATPAAVYLIGVWRMAHVDAILAAPTDEARGGSLRVALIQESVDTIFEYNPERNRQTFATYRERTLEACREHPNLDLVVWPESVFTANSPDYLGGDPRHPELRKRRAEFEDKAAWLARDVNGGRDLPRGARGVWLLVGTVTVDLNGSAPREHNSALLINPQGEVVARYYKNHLVMFGEYIPGGDWLPWLYRVTPMPSGMAAGSGPESIELNGVRLSPSICFESMVPQLIRGQQRRLAAEGRAPDVLVNVTNDGWFWGSSILDMHFQAAQLRTVEHRRPLLVAANTGLSGWVDAAGRVQARGAARRPAVIAAVVEPSDLTTLYQRWGDAPALACLIVGIGACGTALISRGGASRSESRHAA